MRAFLFLISFFVLCNLSAQIPKSGPVITVIAGDTIAPESWVFIDSDGFCYLADGSDINKVAQGIVYVPAGAGDTTQMFVYGENPWSSDSLSHGVTYYLSATSPGEMTLSPPMGYGFRQKLCFSLSDTVIFITKNTVEIDREYTKTKTTNEVRASNTTLTTDTDLQITLQAGKSYQVEVYAVINADNANMDYKYSLSFTGTTLLTHGIRGHSVAGSGAGTDKENTQYALSLPSSTAVTGATSGLAIVRASYFITVGVSGGTFGFNWAQNTTDIGNLTVYAGSYIKAKEL